MMLVIYLLDCQAYNFFVLVEFSLAASLVEISKYRQKLDVLITHLVSKFLWFLLDYFF